MALRAELFELIRTHPCIKLDDVYLARDPELYRDRNHRACGCVDCKRRNSHESAIRREVLKLEQTKAIHSDYVRISIPSSRYPHHNKVMWVGYPGRSRNTLSHDSDVTSFHVRLRQACAEQGLDDPRWKYGTQRNAVTKEVNPDGIFIISRPNGDYLSPFFYEEERKRGHYICGNPQILAKVRRYAAYRRSGRMTADFGFDDARLAIRCTTGETMRNLLRDLELTAPLRWIWITAVQRSIADFAGDIWRTPADYTDRAYSLAGVG